MREIVCWLVLLGLLCAQSRAGVIKDFIQKVTHTNNKTEDVVKQSAPVCGSSLFSTPDEDSLSPEIIFITNRESPGEFTRSRENGDLRALEVATEYRFNVDNVTLDDLERYGFNPDAPVTFLMHGFTSGYPLQAWMTGIVESYTLKRDTQSGSNDFGSTSGTSAGFNSGASPGTSNGYAGGNGYGSSNGYENSGSGSNYGSSSGYDNMDKGSLRDPDRYKERESSISRESSSSNIDRNTGRRNSNGRNNNKESSGSGSSIDYSRAKRFANKHSLDRDTIEGVHESSNAKPYRNSTNGVGSANRELNLAEANENTSTGPRPLTIRRYPNPGPRNIGNLVTQNAPERNQPRGGKVPHNLFIINWNYAARGILYPRAVANIPIVASYATRFINRMLIGEARIESRRIQLIGHSLGAHLAGYIGKNTKSKLGRIYGLDPAGPCFGAFSGFLYPGSKRLAPSDAEEVITIQTNSVLLGIDKPLGKYSVFVEGGEVQPGCKGGGVLRSLSTLTWDGGDFDTIACSHSRAPNLLTFSHNRARSQDTCEMIAYECKDWKSFTEGHCGLCSDESGGSSLQDSRDTPIRSVNCLRIGVDWQYTKPGRSSSSGSSADSRDIHSGASHSRDQDRDRDFNVDRSYRRPSSPQRDYSSTPDRSYTSRENQQDSNLNDQGRHFNRSIEFDADRNNQRNRRDSREDENVQPMNMFIRTSDTQPYCTYHYQVVLELNEPFKMKDPPMSLLLQDSQNTRNEQGSVLNDQFGHKYNDRTYTHLLTSIQKLGRVDHATLLFREGLPQGVRTLKMLHVNYMSHSDPRYRQRYSSHLCPVKYDQSRGKESAIENTRFYFEPCSNKNSEAQS